MTATTRFSEGEKRQIRNQHVWPRLVSIPIALLAVVAIGDPPWGDQPWGIVFLAGVAGYGMFCWASIFHETSHQTLFGSAAANIGLGRVLGTLMFVPYSVYRQVHIRHHAYLNRPEDWELWPYACPNASLWFRRCYVWFDLFLGVPSSAVVYGRMYFHRDSPVQDVAVRRAIAFEYVGIVVFWSALVIGNTLAGRLAEHLLAVGLPLGIAGVLQTVRKLTEHLGMASFDPLLGTRTVLPQRFLLRICSFLHFDIFVHGPHHRHPRATHGSLQGWMEYYQRRSPQLPYPVFSSYWSAVRHMAPSLWRNPACGVNAGKVPDYADLAAVEDFLADSLEIVPHDASDGQWAKTA
ncbi:MAG: fatty acid desaturase [Planctomycetota bacterium]|nr:fatty acid desaturase [Planctomycetota bacterium]